MAGEARGSRAILPAHAAMSGEADLAIASGPGGTLVVTEMHPSDEAIAEMAGASLPTPVVKAQLVAQKHALTGVGAIAGFFVAGPLGVAVGAGVGAAIDWWRGKQAKKPASSGAAATGAPGAGGAVNLLPLRMKNPALTITPLALSTLSASAPPNFPKLKLIKMATTAKTSTPGAPGANPATVAANTAATALHAYFLKYPYDRVLGDTFWKSNAMGILVKAFQTAFNADTQTNQTSAPLSVSGYYDAATSRALTFYTHDPIDPDPNT